MYYKSIISLSIAISNILSKRVIDPINGCWIYTGSKSEDGYGLVCFNGRQFGVHRLIASLCLGLNLSNKRLQVCHKCDNKDCFNWNHLFIANNFIHARYDTNKRQRKLHPSIAPYTIPNINSDNESSYFS